ncbi:hypothetical protein ACLOJK_038019 [Asimina triloba]
MRPSTPFRLAPVEAYSDTNLSSWNANNPDCCSWEGIRCNSFTGHVIALNLSRLDIGGPLNFQSLFQLGSLQRLDLSGHFFGVDASPIPSSTIQELYMSGTAFHGNLADIPRNFKSLTRLEMSGCNIQGSIPTRIFTLTELWYLSLSSNHFSGVVDLGSFQNLKNLEWLDLSDNSLTVTVDTESSLLSTSNNFFGSIGEPWTSPEFFPQLQIIDLSFNNFSGRLPSNLFSTWKMMKDGGSASEFLTANTSMYYQDKVFLVWKGSEIEFVKILMAVTVVDLSHNQFHGDIPTSIGELKALLVLNVSHNHFQGKIPASLRNLKHLESLDLSDNSLSGKIPWQLAELSFLAVLNLSRNQLVGRIPQGRHFDTFQNDSFLGNSELCGLPLSRECEEDVAVMPPATQSDDDESELDFMWIAFGVGHAYNPLLYDVAEVRAFPSVSRSLALAVINTKEIH